MKTSFVCFKLYLLKTVKLAPSWWKVPAEPLQELKLFIRSGAHLQPIGVNDKPLIERFAGSWLRPCQGQQQLCKLPSTPSPSTSQGELGPSSRELARPEIPPQNYSCRAAMEIHWAANWGCFLPKKLCSAPGDNGVFAASGTSGVCSPSLPCARWGYDASRMNVRTFESAPHLILGWAVFSCWVTTIFEISLVSQFSISVFSLGFFAFLLPKTGTWVMWGNAKGRKKKSKFHPYLQLRNFWGGRDLLKKIQ